MEQCKLPLSVVARKTGIDVSIETILRRDTFTKAIIFSLEVAGLQDNLVCEVLVLDPATYCKIKNGSRNFPPDKIIPAMDLAGNEIPLLWLAHKRGYGLMRLQSELEKENAELKQQLLEQSQKFEHFREFMTLGKV